MLSIGVGGGRPVWAAAWQKTERLPPPAGARRWWLPLVAVVACVPVLLILAPMRDDSGVIYPISALLYVAMTMVCLRNRRRGRGSWESRAWMWVGVHSAALAGVYAVATVGSWATAPSWRVISWLETAGQMLAFGACLKAFLSALRERDGVQRVLDGVLLLTLCALLFLTVSSRGPLGVRPCRLWVAPLREGFLWGCALAYGRAWTGREHRRLAGVVQSYLLLSAVAAFASNIVPMWVGVSARGDAVLNSIFALPMLCFVAKATKAEESEGAEAGGAAVGGVWLSMLPSLLLLACVGLALLNAARFPRGSVVLIGGAVVVFAVRTQAFSRRLLAEKAALVASSRAMEELATVDALTGVRNRRWLEVEGARMLQGGGEGRAGLLLLDTDRFKEVNDTYGHAAGDALLLRLSEMMRGVVRGWPRAACVRLGGDEFVVLLPGAERTAAALVADQLGAEARTLVRPDGRPMTVSIGLATTMGPVPLGALLELADEALYRAKARGRDRVEVAEEDASAFARSARHTEARRFRPETDAGPARGVAAVERAVAAAEVSP